MLVIVELFSEFVDLTVGIPTTASVTTLQGEHIVLACVWNA